VKGEQIEVIVIEDQLMMRKAVELLLRHEVCGSLALLVRSARPARSLHDVVTTSYCSTYTSAARARLSSSKSCWTATQRRRSSSTRATRTGVRGSRRRRLAGAPGFVLKGSPVPRLVEALVSVAAGGTYVDPDLAPLLFESAHPSPLSLLSPREAQVIDLLADGLNGHAIAERLVLSPETIRTHVRNATMKLGAKTRVQAVALVVQARGSA